MVVETGVDFDPEVRGQFQLQQHLEVDEGSSMRIRSSRLAVTN